MLIGDIISVVITLVIVAFFAIPTTRGLYSSANSAVPVLLAFIKFAILATGGEILAWRIKHKTFNLKGFGLLPKIFLWGIFGIIIYWAFGIFSGGVPKVFPFLANLPEPWHNILTAFAISLFLNFIFSPIFMTTHHLADSFINANHGRLPLRQFNMLAALKGIDWDRMWGFVFTKTIPFFWIPAHTITFMLPSEWRMIFAAGLSVFLGIILGSVNKNRKK
ncbi:MAG: hypothetical protein CVU42_04220 [Chloroflexi bacterium HGW-Chloroflexi-4]|jgi:hypothetical protein|nr:MAG: hypothetical protein CVU42_04220 [Chloroflexi bacterium HGW-Chloroflexi-4]